MADSGYTALQQLPGIGPILAAVFTAEIGEVTRFRTADQLACWAGLTPKHHESDTHVHRGRITKQGSRLVRWAAVESVKRLGPTTVVGAYKGRSRTGAARTSAPSRPPASRPSSSSTRCVTTTSARSTRRCTQPHPRHEIHTRRRSAARPCRS